MKGKVRSRALQRDFPEKAPHRFLLMGVFPVPGALGERGTLDLGRSFSSRSYFSFRDVDGDTLSGIAGIWTGVHLSEWDCVGTVSPSPAHKAFAEKTPFILH